MGRSHGLSIAAAAVTWLVAGLSFAELVRGIVAVGEVGGYCRDGGAIVSAVACPDGAPARIMLSGLGLAFAVIANIALAKGLGPDLPAVVLPGLFGVLGVLYIIGALNPFRWVWLVSALAFLVVCGVVLRLNRDSGWRRVAIGSRMLDGTPIAHPNRALYHRSVPHPGTAHPTAAQSAGLAALGFVPFAAGIAAGLVI